MERMEEIGMAPLDPSLIYRALHALEAEGLISSTWDDKETQGPPRRMYQLTQFGEEMLAQYVDDLKHSKQQIDHLLAIYDRQMNAGQEHSDSKEKG
jgi:PadR family transcriptional regulator PadR